jgi:hypothetical protein
MYVDSILTIDYGKNFTERKRIILITESANYSREREVGGNARGDIYLDSKPCPVPMLRTVLRIESDKKVKRLIASLLYYVNL